MQIFPMELTSSLMPIPWKMPIQLAFKDYNSSMDESIEKDFQGIAIACKV